MDLAFQQRDIFGKKTKSLRAKGLVPAELYGRGVKNVHIMMPAREFVKVYRAAGENTVINLDVVGKKTPVLIHDVTYHPVTDEIASVDFYQVRLDEKLRTKVPVQFTGESAAVKHRSGVLIKALKEIEVEALPNDLPHSFVMDLGALAELEQSVYVRDLKIPTGVKVFAAMDAVVATVKPQMTEEQAKALEEAAVPSVETVKVEVEEKVALRQAHGEAERTAEKEAIMKTTTGGKPAVPTPEAKR